jgi:integrase
MSDRHRLTEKLVKGAATRAAEYRLFDEEVRGFGLVVYPSGSRGFVLMYRFAHRKRIYTIGRWPEWSVVAARERARLLRRDVDAGVDPQDGRTAAREAPTVAVLADRYAREHLPRLAKRNASDQRSMLDKLVLPAWKHRMVGSITEADVEDLLAAIAEGRARPAKAEACSRGRRKLQPARPTPVRANRVGEVLRKMFSLAVKWKMRADNPAQGFYRRGEVERDRFLSIDEIDRLAAALNAAEDQRAASIMRMCMLTGARLGEVREARFEQFDLNHLIWTKQSAHTKQRRTHRLPISEDVAAIVRQRRVAVAAGVGWLFPGDALGADGLPKDQPVQDLRKFWSAIQREAGLPDVRVHDLRHTFASLLATGGSSLALIGKLLGHTQAQTTRRYAHLAERPLREGVDSVAALLRPRPRLVHRE